MSAFRFEIAMKCYYYLSCGNCKVKSFFLSIKLQHFISLTSCLVNIKTKIVSMYYYVYGALK